MKKHTATASPQPGSNARGSYRFLTIGRWVWAGMPPASWVAEGAGCFFPRSYVCVAAVRRPNSHYWTLLALNARGRVETIILGSPARLRVVSLLSAPTP